MVPGASWHGPRVNERALRESHSERMSQKAKEKEINEISFFCLLWVLMSQWIELFSETLKSFLFQASMLFKTLKALTTFNRMHNWKVYDTLLLIDSPDGRGHTTGEKFINVEHFSFPVRHKFIFNFRLLRFFFLSFWGNDWKIFSVFMCVFV